jgi:hypothetical protein
MWAFYEERWQCIVWTKNGETLFFSISGVGMRAGFPSVLFFAIDGNLEISFLMLYKNGQNVSRRMRNCQPRRRHAKIPPPHFREIIVYHHINLTSMRASLLIPNDAPKACIFHAEDVRRVLPRMLDRGIL